MDAGDQGIGRRHQPLAVGHIDDGGIVGQSQGARRAGRQRGEILGDQVELVTDAGHGRSRCQAWAACPARFATASKTALINRGSASSKKAWARLRYSLIETLGGISSRDVIS